MTAEAFDAVLAEPDSSAAQSRLHGLITAKTYHGITLPAVAGRYLHAFCDVTASSLRRRWVGIALSGMMAASRKVPLHLEGLHRDLHALGDIILSSAQSEEIKIIAGIVLRQCRERGITYNNFWSSDKVRKSIPNFPERSGPRWMSDFQKFLDQLGHLALVSTSTDPSIIYPISIVASDGFRWRDPNDSLPIALIQGGMLTVIAPDEALQDVQFVDIPISRIQSVLCQPSTLHNSQALVSEHEPWDIVLSLQVEPWSYRLNTSRRAGTDITILFAHALDAREWEASIKECQVLYERSRKHDISKGHSNMSSSSWVDGGLSSPSAKLRKSGIQPMEHTSAAQHQPLTQNKHSDETERRNPHNSTGKLRTEKSNLVREVVGTARSRCSRPTNGSATAEITKTKDQDYIEARQGEDRTQPSSLSKDLTSLRQFDIPEHSVSPDSLSIRGRTTAPEHEVSLLSPSKEPTRGNGKLPKISQATKLKAYKQLPEKQETSSITKQRAAATKVVKRAVASTVVKSASKLQKQWSRSSQPRNSSAGSTRSQVKRKAGDDDEEYVPDEARSGRRTRKRQKNALKTTAAKRPIAGTLGRDQITGSGTIVPTPNPRPVGQHAVNEREVEQQKASSQQVDNDTPHPLQSSRHSLITGLLSEQLPPKPTALSNMHTREHPARGAEDISKSTSQADQPIPHFKRPQTPGDMQIRPNFVPPAMYVMRGSKDDFNREQQATFIEILSSNSKPVPASPNADSSAISGHADCNEIVIEKEKGDWQTAQSDPFNRRSSNTNSTAFMRRLTGEDPTNSIHVSEDLSSYGALPGQSTPVNIPALEPAYVRSSPPPAPRYTPSMGNFNQPPAVHSRAKERVMPKTKFPEDDVHVKTQRSAPQFAIEILKSNEATNVPIPRPFRNTVEVRALGTHAARAIDPVRTYVNKQATQTIRTAAKGAVEGKDDRSGPPKRIAHIAQTVPTIHGHEDLYTEGETTLIGDAKFEQPFLEPKASSIHFRSSPPVIGSLGSRSSTSAEVEAPSPSPLPTSEAELMDWEASLEPHQRPLHDIIIRVSKRVIRRIVDNETAVTDIVEVFEKDAEHVLRSLLQEQHREYNHVFGSMENKTKQLKSELEVAAGRLKEDRRRFKTMI